MVVEFQQKKLNQVHQICIKENIMYYLYWFLSAFSAVAVGCFVASKIDKKEKESNED